MKNMIKTMPEATQIFIDEERRRRDERLATQREKAAIAAACAELDERFGGTHEIGSAGSEDTNVRLLGAVDIEHKRYARLKANMGRVVCVPWIDAFAEFVGQQLSIRWSEDTTHVRNFRVSGADGIIEGDEDEAIDGRSFAP